MTAPDAPAIRLLIVDDHAVVRIGLRTLLGAVSGIEVVGEVGSVAGAVSEALRLQPAVVLMDMRLPDGTGVDACREILAVLPQAHVLFLTSYDDQDAMLAAVYAGALGYLLKQIDSDALVRAVQSVAAGKSIMDAAATQTIKAQFDSMSESGSSRTGSVELSAQEQRVLALVAKGNTNKEIAAALQLSDKTVKNYLSNIYQKLHVSRRSQAAVIYSKKAPR